MLKEILNDICFHDYHPTSHANYENQQQPLFKGIMGFEISTHYFVSPPRSPSQGIILL